MCGEGLQSKASAKSLFTCRTIWKNLTTVLAKPPFALETPEGEGAPTSNRGHIFSGGINRRCYTTGSGKSGFAKIGAQ